MNAVGIIPARLFSTRFPRKILHLIDGKPLVVHVYERACAAQSLSSVIIAIDHKDTEDALRKFGVKMVMTQNYHKSGSDRVGEVARSLDAEVILNIQGDELLLEPGLVDELVEVFEDKTIKMATAANTHLKPEDIYNRNAVKVLLDQDGFAINFCREPIKGEIGGYYHHIGIYAYRKETLLAFTNLPPSKNEERLNLEQLRALDNGIPIRVILTQHIHRGVDTMEDLIKIKAYA